MLTLFEYKELLVNHCKYKFDNTELKKENRRKKLINEYQDDFLEKIIKDTYSFIRLLLDLDLQDKDTYSFPVNNISLINISLNDYIEDNADEIFVFLDNILISKRILKEELGEDFYIAIKEEEHYTGYFDSLVKIKYSEKIDLKNFPDNLDEIEKRLFGTGRQKGSN